MQPNFSYFGILSSNTAAQNKSRLQTAMDEMWFGRGGGSLVADPGRQYELEPGLNKRNNVEIIGNVINATKGGPQPPYAEAGTYLPGDSCFIIRSNADNVFKGSDVKSFSIRNFGFDYPEQPIGTTNPSSAIQYPATIAGGKGCVSHRYENLYFVGAWKMMEFTKFSGEDVSLCADIHIKNINGYPLSGRGIFIDRGLDICRIENCLFSPSVGNPYRQSIGLDFVHSKEVCRSVMDKSFSFIDWNATDEFYMSGNFGFAYPTFIKATASYGSILQSHCDIGKNGLDLNCDGDGGGAQRSIRVADFSHIGSGGTNPAERNGIILRGSGTYDFGSINSKIGDGVFNFYTSQAPSGFQTGPNNNAVMRIENAGSPVITIGAIHGRVYGSAVYSYDIQNLNSNAKIKAPTGVDVPSAATKISASANVILS